MIKMWYQLPTHIKQLIGDFAADTEIIYVLNSRSLGIFNVDTRKLRRYGFTDYCINAYKVGKYVATAHYEASEMVIHLREKMNIIYTFAEFQEGYYLEDVVYLNEDVVAIQCLEMTMAQTEEERRHIILWRFKENTYTYADISGKKIVAIDKEYFAVKNIGFDVLTVYTGEVKYSYESEVEHIGSDGVNVIFNVGDTVYTYYRGIVRELYKDFPIVSINEGVIYGRDKVIYKNGETDLLERLDIGMTLKRYGGYLYAGDGKKVYKIDKEIIDEYDVDSREFILTSDAKLF
jgi:hypothetical protein